MSKQLIVLVSIAMGAVIVINAATSTSYSLLNLFSSPVQKPWLAIFSVLPTFIALGAAYLIFRYAKGIHTPPGEETGDAFLFGCTKLLGLYLFIQALARLFISIGAFSRTDLVQDSAYITLSIAMTYLIFGYLLTFKTTSLLKFINDRNGS